MPNQIDENGLQVKTVTEILSDLTLVLQDIYGADINLDQNSPDGQLINIVAQADADRLELLVDVNNSFDVELAYGVVLDQRVALNGLTRRAGTYTTTPVSVTVDRALNLVGLDGAVDPVGDEFVLYDSAGNDFILVTSVSIAVAGTASYTFRAKDVGNVQVTLNDITNQRTVVLGVTAVNNPSAVSVQGVDEETDAQLKLRHAASFQLGSTGAADSVEAGLLATTGVTDAVVIENDTDAPVNSVPAHSLWCIVDGGTDADVGTTIYNKKAPGCGLYGGESYSVTRPNGTTYTANFDRAIAQDLYIQFSISPVSGSGSYDSDLIKEQLADALSYRINQGANVGQVVAAMLTIAPSGYLTDIGVSTNGSDYYDSVTPTSAQYRFAVAVARIDIV